MNRKLLWTSLLSLALAIALFFWKLTPFYRTDEVNERVMMLGGMIQIDSSEGSLKIAGRPVELQTNLKEFKGERPSVGKNLVFRFVTSNVRFLNGSDSTLRWQCQIPTKEPRIVEISASGAKTTFDFEPARYSKCSVEVPVGSSIEIQAEQGRVELVQPKFPTQIQMQHGKVVVTRAPGQAYRFENQLNQVELIGQKELSEKSPADATPIRLKIDNGILLVR